MPRNYFITGEPKTGKTTLLKELVAELKKGGLRVGGFVSPEERHHGTRTAFQVMDVDTGKKAQLANVDGDGPKVSKYHVDVRSFESIAVPSMEKAGDYDVFVIDEIGVMEMKSGRFSRLLDKIMESDTPLIATLHEHYIDTYSGSGEVLDLDSENRQQVYMRLLGMAKGSISKKPAKAEAKKEAKPAPKPAPKKAAPKAKEKPAKAAKKEKPKKEEAP
jgi:nucleoside-triphosphatase